MHLLLIGGGEIGAQRADGTYRPLETLEIDHYFLKLINKKHPHILFIPTAIEQKDPNKLYELAFKSLYEDKLGCQVSILNIKDEDTPDYFNDILSSCDAIYISGGDTEYMLTRWKKTGFDICLTQAALNGKIIAGISAGAMCWFENVLAEDENLSLISGLNLIKHMCIPHWNKYKDIFLNRSVVQTTPFIAIDNCCAVEISNEAVNIISAKEHALAYYYDIKSGQKGTPLTKQEIHIINT